MSAVAQRDKRSISLPPKLARQIELAAARERTTFSEWLARAAERRLKLDAGRHVLAGLELPGGPLTEAELAEGIARARRSLGLDTRQRSRRSA